MTPPAPSSGPPPAPGPPHHRRHHSELDMNSLRRVGDALLLAQNRARRASERAARSERLLRAVFARVDGPTAAALRLEMDALYSGDGGLDWRPPSDAVDALALDPSLAPHLLAGRRRALEDDPDGLEVSQGAREIVASLGSASTRHRLLVDRAAADDSARGRRRPPPPPPSRLVPGLSPLQFVAGLLVGVCVGAALARAAAQPLARRPSLVRALSQWCKARARVGRYYAAAHPPLPFPLDDLGYWGAPPAPAALEVAS